MTTTHLTDIEKDGLEEVFSVLNMEYKENSSLIYQITSIFKKIINSLF